MYVLNELKGKKLLIVGGSPDKEELRRILGALELTEEDVKFVTQAEMQAMEMSRDIAKLSDIVHEIKAIPKLEMPFIEPKRKPHHDRNVRRHYRKSRW